MNIIKNNAGFTGAMSPEALKSMIRMQDREEQVKKNLTDFYDSQINASGKQKDTSVTKSGAVKKIDSTSPYLPHVSEKNSKVSVMNVNALKSMIDLQGRQRELDNHPNFAPKSDYVIRSAVSTKKTKKSEYNGGYTPGDIDILSRLQQRSADVRKNSNGAPTSISGAQNYNPKSLIYKNAKAENELYLIQNGIYVPDKIEPSDEMLYKMAYSFKNSLGNTELTFKSDFERKQNMIDQARNLKAIIAYYDASGKKLPEGFDVLKLQLDNMDMEYKKTLASIEPMIPNTSIRALKPGEEFRDPTVGELARDSILSGLNSFNSALFKTLDFVLPTELALQLMGIDEGKDLISDLADYYSGLHKFYSDKSKINAYHLGETAEKITPLIESTVAALPHAVLAMMSGGASLSSSGSSLSSVGKSAISEVASNFAKNPSFWLSAMQTMGNEYETAINAGANEFVASSYAILSSLINAGVEVGGGIDKLAEKIKGGNGTKLLDWVISSAAEGGEEFVQGIVSNSLAKVMYDPDIKTFSMTPGEKAIFNVPDSVEEVKAGAFVGGILGGGQVAIDTVARNISSVTNADISNIYSNQTLNEMLKNKELDRRTALAINNLGKRMESKVVFTEYLIDEHGNFANATLSGDGKTMFISRHSTDPLVVAAFHESVHYLKKADIDTYNSIVSDMKEYALNDDEYRNSHAVIVKNIEEKSYSDYMSGDAQIDTDFIEEEFTSSALSYLFSDAKNVKKFAQENFNGFQRVVDNVIHLFEKNISMYEGRDKSVRDMYEPIIDKLKEQKKSIIQRYDDGISGTVNDYAGVDKYSLVGIRADGIPVFETDQTLKTLPLSERKNLLEEQLSNSFIGKTARFERNGHLYYAKFDDLGINKNIHGDKKSDGPGYITKINLGLSGDLFDLIEELDYKNFDFERGISKKKAHQNLHGWYYLVKTIQVDHGVYDILANIRLSKDNNQYVYSIQLTENKKVGVTAPVVSYDSHIKSSVHMNRGGTHFTYNDSLLQNEGFENSQYDENSPADLGNINENVNGKFSLPQGTIPESSKKQIDSILHRAGNRYGISDLSQDELSGVSLSQKDIDARLGREFAFDNDIRVQSQYRDRFNNSLHLSDSVIFRYGDGSDASFGTGRILGFESDGSVGICVDSGETYSNTITLDAKNVFFVAHNNVETVSKDFVTSNLAYSSAKESFDHFGLTGDISRLRKFGFNRAQNYLFSSSNKVNAIYSKLLSMTEKYERYDDGVYEGHIYYNSFNDKNANAFTYDDMSPYGLLTQLYDAVRNYNLSKDISDIFISMGASPVDYDKMAEELKSADLIGGSIKGYPIGFSPKNGNYYFVDVHRNFERTFGKYYDVVKPILDNFDRSKGNYARSIISKCKEASDLYAKYDFKPGSIEDKVIQLYGEGEGQFNLNKESDILLFEKLGFSADAHSGEKTVTVPIDYQRVVNLFGDEKARQIDECVRFFKAQYDEYLGRVNDTISRIYPGQSHRLIQPRSDYFRHFQEMGEGLRGFLNTLSSDIQIDPRLSGISERTKPKQSFESFRQERKGKKTDFSAIYGFVDYMLQAEYTINIDPNIKEFRELRQNLAEMKASRGEDNLNQFLKYLDNFANHLSKKTLMADRILMDYIGTGGRSFIRRLSYLNNAAMKSAVMYNPAVAAKQILNLKNGIFYLQDPTLLINSVVGLCKSCTDTDLWSKYDSLFKQSNYLAERYLSRAFPSSKSNAGKIAEDFISIGDEFGCRAIWLAAHEDALRLGASDPVIYADDIARKCSAGRGIGEKPLAFSNQVTKMFLPFLLENNNNWNVLRDFAFNPAKSKNADDHQFSDDNSYLYYKNQKSTGKKIFGNSMRLAFYLLTTFAIGDLIEELTGFRPEFDPVNDVVKGFSKATRFNDGRFDAKVLVDTLLNSSKNLLWDFAEHRNFSSVYSAALSWVSDDPLESHVDIFGSVPVVSTLNNAAHSFKDGDVAGGVLNLATGFIPGGGQIRKSIKGFGDVFQGGKYNEPFTKTIFGAKKGGKVYDVAKTPGNYAKAILFGPSSLPEAQKFYDEKEMNSEFSLFNKDKKDKQYSEFEKKFRKSGGVFEKEISRLQDELGSDNVIPYYYVEEEYEYKDSYGVSHTFALTGKDRDKIQADVNNELYNEFKKVYSSEKFKNSDDSGKAKLLSDARSKVIGSYKDEIISKEKNRAIVDAYMYAHGKSEYANLYKKTGNIDVLPIYESSRVKNFTSQGQNVSFELTDNQMSYYNKVGNEKLEQSFKEAMMSYDWANISDEEKVKRLEKARSKAEGIVSDYIKYDYLYKEHISEFDSKYGADNPIRKAYEYSHDPTVYPYWILDDSVSFTYKGKSYTYNLKKEQGSYGNTSEYEAWSEYYNETLRDAYVNIAIGGGYLDNLSDKELYEKIIAYKKQVRSDVLNVQMRNYSKVELGLIK